MSKKQELEEYWESPAWSQSKLKKICFAAGEDDSGDTKSTFRGNLTDTVITSPELFKDLYYVDNNEKPSDTVQKIIKNVFDKTEGSFRAEYESYQQELIIEAILQGYGNGKYTDDRLWGILSKERGYWNSLVKAEGKILVTQAEINEANQTKEVLLNHPVFKHYFSGNLFYTIKYQTPLYANIEGLDCKGLPDILIFDSSEMTIKEVDLKTTGVSRQEFPKIARRFRYDFQKAFYKALLKKCYPEWEVVNGEWLVIPKNINKPFVLPVSSEDYWIGEHGTKRTKSEVQVNKKKVLEEDFILGWRDAIEKVKQCQELGIGDFDLDYYQNGGILSSKSIWI